MTITSRIACRIARTVRRYAADVRGNVAMMFALILPVLVLATLGGVDIHRAASVRMNLQDALDAATLAAARSTATTDEALTTIGLAALEANLAPYGQITLVPEQTSFTLSNSSTVIGVARVNATALVANIFLPPYGEFFDDQLPINARAEVNRSSKNIEVGLVLDITGSMGTQDMIALRAAATQLVDIVVQPTQSPYTTRMAIIPYSVGVNMDSWAAGARGTPVQSRPITGASWTTGSSININGITQASPGVVTTSGNHGLNTNDFVWISGVTGMTQINNKAYRVVRVNNTRFSLQSWNGSSWAAVNTTSGNGYGSYTASNSDIVRKCQVSDCTVVITSAGHGIPATTTDTGTTQPGTVRISGVGGMTQINATSSTSTTTGVFEVANVTTNTYSLVGVVGPNVGTYTSGGTSQCGQNGCEYRVFRAANNVLTAYRITNCATERLGTERYTGVGPATAFVGRHYGDPNLQVCPSATIQPLSSSISGLKSKISGLTSGGPTAGHIGLAWGWYTIAPTFNSLWSGNAANPYDPNETIKAVIMMTDGDFNSPYCTGVISRDMGDSNTPTSRRANCNATNGSSFTQATALCTSIKQAGVVIYTVGFGVPSGGGAASFLASCATSSDHAFLPTTGANLTESFAAIGRDITRLRISR
ncbi:MAG: ubiquitin-activating E1 FCCH domain-containing protein [Brevundimonas sp.]|uniref:TadE/TadG family type IV pilus assembly protein n=1 Tax=Brevundimonas sp. TaxID=1871086 RepID=UPI0027368B3D|nr:TadE/TadG family type IV pilus assembly protein [Brevundimonas sp.]MDP3405328.1 ubiquitin-activating E1 FCCH domain-containing protein [Brevundimonas sp.]